ncbi:uncharacterized protein ARMOST_18162 [Armillaria ostoyae]|uniref:Uncharacterized protein n=1 Tax=Armillaria ostoyae TaxID=47428 RepID=A0A284S160_ARMOS|nr:uncharacterized protein ARMOST_18162 [Armillaria ostoyae]
MDTNSTSLRLATYSLRYDWQPDQITIPDSALGNPLAQDTFLGLSGEQPWSTRRLHVAEHLLSEDIVIAGFQEALLNDLAELFGDDCGWIGVGRSDGMERGEYCPLFYKKSAVKLLSNDTFWLSDTPFKPSKYPRAGTFRLLAQLLGAKGQVTKEEIGRSFGSFDKTVQVFTGESVGIAELCEKIIAAVGGKSCDAVVSIPLMARVAFLRNSFALCAGHSTDVKAGAGWWDGVDADLKELREKKDNNQLRLTA